MKLRTLLALALICQPATAQTPVISCDGIMCTLPRVVLMELVADARRAQQYATMCNWVKERK